MKKKITTIIISAVGALFLAMLIVVICFVNKNNDAEAGGNQLDESCWKLSGQLMSYDRKGYDSMIGVDVSKWNGSVDWKELKRQGVEFALIRIGYRGYESGEIVLDELFYENIEGAASAGLKIGIYFFSQAINKREAEEEAEFVLEKLQGYDITLPVFLDTEPVRDSNVRTNIIPLESYTENAIAFCDTIQEHGYNAGVYASKKWFKWVLDLTSLENYEIWYANYGNTPGKDIAFDIWQYSSEGILAGCDTALDLNVRVIKRK